MKTTVTQRVVLGILSFFLLVYAAVQVYRFVKGQYKTETVYSYTVSENLRVNGVAIREEEVLEDTIDDGIATYLNSNGTKVSKGTPIAEIYDNRQDAENVRKLPGVGK